MIYESMSRCFFIFIKDNFIKKLPLEMLGDAIFILIIAAVTQESEILHGNACHFGEYILFGVSIKILQG